MKSIYHYCIGDSHLSTNKPCQDYAYADSSDRLSIAIVSDGHGGERYFRSQYGSRFLVEITKDAIRSFVDTIEEEGNDILKGEPFTEYISSTASQQQTGCKTHKSLKWLFSSIINQWNQKIAQHASENDLDQWELDHVEEKYRVEFAEKRTQSDATFEKTYGCTLMAYVQTPDYWFAFHIGDGKLVTMHLVDDLLECRKPVPWDDKCFLNKTTSICDSNAIEEFRYCYQGDGNFPVAAFLGSDGMDDSYGDGEQLYNFYVNLYKQIAKSGIDEAGNVLRRSLPKISKIGSKDDMSVACVFDELNIRKNFYAMADYQLKQVRTKFLELFDKSIELQNRICTFGSEDSLDTKQRIDLQYAQKDLDKVEKQIKKVKAKERDIKDEIVKFDRGQKKEKTSKPKPKNNLQSRFKNLKLKRK